MNQIKTNKIIFGGVSPDLHECYETSITLVLSDGHFICQLFLNYSGFTQSKGFTVQYFVERAVIVNELVITPNKLHKIFPVNHKSLGDYNNNNGLQKSSIKD